MKQLTQAPALALNDLYSIDALVQAFPDVLSESTLPGSSGTVTPTAWRKRAGASASGC